MVRHVILWKLKEEFTPEEKARIRAGIKEGLEGLQGKIPGLISIRVTADGLLPSSNADVMLDSCFESADALRAYAKNPVHNAVADTKVRPFVQTRLALDFEV